MSGSVLNEYRSNSSEQEQEHAPQLTEAALIRVYVLVILGTVSLIGNIATLIHIIKTKSIRRNSRRNASAFYTLILHLAIADLLVTIFCIFGEAYWSFTVAWVAGEFACKFMKLFQMFALYLSTYVLVLIGINRWVAVKYPMKSCDQAKRCHRWLILSCALSFLLSLPQVSQIKSNGRSNQSSFIVGLNPRRKKKFQVNCAHEYWIYNYWTLFITVKSKYHFVNQLNIYDGITFRVAMLRVGFSWINLRGSLKSAKFYSQALNVFAEANTTSAKIRMK